MKRAERIEKNDGLVVREVVEADAATGGAAYGPGMVRQAWAMALKGLAHQVAFGAMLCEIDAGISRVRIRSEDGRLGGQEEGLKSWLDEHCPEVHYKTAMRWKAMAEGTLAALAKDGFGGVAARVIPQAVGMVPGAEDVPAPTLERLRELLDGSSGRDLLAAARGPGRPKGTPGGGRRALSPQERAADAEREIGELLGRLVAYATGPKIGMLAAVRRGGAAATLRDVAACFRDNKPFKAG